MADSTASSRANTSTARHSDGDYATTSPAGQERQGQGRSGERRRTTGADSMQRALTSVVAQDSSFASLPGVRTPSPNQSQASIWNRNGSGYAPLPGSEEEEEEEPSPFANTNVQMVMLYTLFQYIGLAVWQGQFLSLYLFSLCDSNAVVGSIEGAQGMARLFTALIAGWLVDKLRERTNTVLVVSTVYGLLLYGFCIYCVIFTDTVYIWYVALCLYSPLRSLQISGVDSIFANSTRTGQRVRVYTVRRQIAQFGQLVGKGVQIIIYWQVGNTFTKDTYTVVLVAGIASQMLGCLPQLVMDHNKTLGAASEAKGTKPKAPVATPTTAPPRGSTNAEVPDDETATLAKRAKRVRYGVVFFDLIRNLSAGIATKYFGLFFVQTYNMTPIGFAVLQLTRPICMIICTQFSSWLTRCAKRAWVVFVTMGICAVSAGVMGYDFGSFASSNTNLWSFWIDAVAWVIMSASLNALFAVKQSILMDHVAKKNRGKWNSLADMQASFWSGTAVIGGFLSEAHGYRLVFLVQAAGYLLAEIPWIPVITNTSQ